MKKAILTGLAAIALAGMGCASMHYSQRDVIEQEGSEFLYHDITWDREHLELTVRVVENGEIKKEIRWTRYEPANSAACTKETIQVYSKDTEDYTVTDESCDFRLGPNGFINADSATGYSHHWGNLDGNGEEVIMPDGGTIERDYVVNDLFGDNMFQVIRPRFENTYQIIADYHRWKRLE